MIVAERKPFEDIKAMIEDYNKILVVGCGECVSVCMAGGEKEVQILASQLRLAFEEQGKEIEVDETTLERQCDKEYLEEIKDKIDDYDAIISMACGAGVQFLAEMYNNKSVYPALNTCFIGVAEREGEWSERCRACGDCVLAETGGICPVAICAKGLLNGPCGGTNDGKCELSKEKDCAWTLIYNRLKDLDKLDNIREIFPPKKYSAQTTPGRRIHEAFKEKE
ncbi:MAG: methylenetetrahydrofolate reductase C-terminal domain-containing protein [Thermodesulfobacteriota bacterium]|nr:methylenetetrahydrofolate reductase C-terminal domain-containing protein [Thermodesulfobacteriota bacterium]